MRLSQSNPDKLGEFSWAQKAKRSHIKTSALLSPMVIQNKSRVHQQIFTKMLPNDKTPESTVAVVAAARAFDLNSN